MENAPQFSKQQRVPLRTRDDAPLLIAMFVGPVVVGATILFWLGLDDPPLEWLGVVVAVGALLVTLVSVGTLLQNNGMPTLLAALLAVFVTPGLVVGAMFVLIAGAFMLGGMVNDLLG